MNKKLVPKSTQDLSRITFSVSGCEPRIAIIVQSSPATAPNLLDLATHKNILKFSRSLGLPQDKSSQKISAKADGQSGLDNLKVPLCLHFTDGLRGQTTDHLCPLNLRQSPNRSTSLKTDRPSFTEPHRSSSPKYDRQILAKSPNRRVRAGSGTYSNSRIHKSIRNYINSSR
jgi:hypothetical protein